MSFESDRAEVARILISNADSIGIHTGNILNWTMLKKHRFHPSMTSSDEVSNVFEFFYDMMNDLCFDS